MERRVDATPDALMLVDEDMRTLTFSEFWSEAELTAAGLHAAGLGHEDAASWQMPNWIDTFVLVAALSRLEVVQNPLDTRLSEQDVERIAAEVGSGLLIVPSKWEGRDLEDTATSIARRNGTMRVLVADRALPQGDPTALPALTGGSDPVDDDPVRWVFHTTGTAGPPRTVRHSDGTIAAAAKGLCQRLGLIEHDRHALIGPVTGVEGIAWLFASLQSGCSNIVTGAFTPEDTCEVLAREGVTLAGSEPAHVLEYVQHQRRELQPVFPDLRGFVTTGSAKPDGLLQDARSLFDVPVLSAYGSTEAPLLTVASITDTAEELHGEGVPLPGVEVRLVQFDGTIVTGSEEGEIRVRAPQMMKGYLDRDATEEAFDDDGFFRTGDLGRLDDSGILSVTGRLRNIVVRPVGNVSARQLEDLLNLHEKVADVAIIGLPDPEAGERICAVVQVVGGHDDLTIDEVIIHLRSSGLDLEELPERLEIVDALPRSPSGELLRQALRDELKG
jgi:cyclohexanecarboxylate-CoA ligase